jgi:pimeloyl-ACP methyl ester carboxylesterase
MRSLRTLFLAVLLTAAVCYVGVCGYLFTVQRSLIFHPQPRADQPGVTLLTLHTVGGVMLLSTRPRPGPTAVLYFGGNVEDVTHDMSTLTTAFPDRAIYLLHYPGYDGSSGAPSESSIDAAAFAAFDRIRAEHPDITIIGRSFGTGVAVRVAAERPVARLVLVTPYASLADAAATLHPYIPVHLLLRDKFDSWKYAPEVHAPTRILAAADDELIPRASTERLRDHFQPGLVDYAVLPGNHETISASPAYLPLLAGK